MMVDENTETDMKKSTEKTILEKIFEDTIQFFYQKKGIHLMPEVRGSNSPAVTGIYNLNLARKRLLLKVLEKLS